MSADNTSTAAPGIGSQEEYYARAELLLIFIEKLRKSKENFGDDHPNTLHSMVALAALYEKLDEQTQCEALFVDCMKKIKMAVYVEPNLKVIAELKG